MRFFGAWAGLAALSATVVSAQASLTVAPTASPTGSAPAQTWTVLAGDGNFQFNPSVLYANVGDYVTWQFYPITHSVVRAAYGNPCIPINHTNEHEHQFATDWFNVSTYTDVPTFTIRINDTEPIWYYCSTPGSCNQKGMVGAINPFANQSFDKQHQEALNAPFVLQPDGSGGLSENGGNGSSSSSGSSGLSGGAIAGIVVGGVVAVVLIGALIYYMTRSKAYNEMLKGTRTHKKRPAPVPAPIFSGNPEMGYPGHDDWKGPHSAMTSPAFPPPYANPEQGFPGQAQPYPNLNAMNASGMAPQQQQQQQGHFQGQRPAGLSRFSELGPSPGHSERNIHELETPLVSPMRFDDGEDMQKR